MKKVSILPTALAVLWMTACGSSPAANPDNAQPFELPTDPVASISLTSTAFEEGAAIPAQYTCQPSGNEKDVSPPLAWGEPPAGTESFALILDDPDAPGGNWVHWIVFNIPAEARGLPESFPANPTLPDGSVSGSNSWARTGYGGPCPPSGTHRYVFTLFALDDTLAITPGANRGELEKAMYGHILAQGTLTGTYTR